MTFSLHTSERSSRVKKNDKERQKKPKHYVENFINSFRPNELVLRSFKWIIRNDIGPFLIFRLHQKHLAVTIQRTTYLLALSMPWQLEGVGIFMRMNKCVFDLFAYLQLKISRFHPIALSLSLSHSVSLSEINQTVDVRFVLALAFLWFIQQFNVQYRNHWNYWMNNREKRGRKCAEIP